jgi:hypothetical protein
MPVDDMLYIVIEKLPDNCTLGKMRNRKPND